MADKITPLDVPFEQEIIDLSVEIKADDVTDAGTFKGIASTMGGTADDGGDIILPGAFDKTLAEGGRNGTGPAFLWSHWSSEPLGIWKALKATSSTLQVTGEFNMDTQLGREKHSLTRQGAVKGLSIGFGIPDGMAEIIMRADSRIRKIKEVVLWEISLVTFPMNRRAQVTAVKAFNALLAARDERSFERGLRESGVSKQAALYITKLAKAGLRELDRPQVDNNEFEKLFAEVKDARNKIIEEEIAWKR